MNCSTSSKNEKKNPLTTGEMESSPFFVGVGLYLMGLLAVGAILEGVGALVSFVGLGSLIAGYLYPNTGKELTNAVEEFEKK
jgi:hypothetical protein